MPDNTNAAAAPSPEPNPGQSQPNLSVVPGEANSPASRNTYDQEVAAELKLTADLCAAARLPEFAAGLLTRKITVPFLDALEADAALVSQKAEGAVNCDSARSDASDAEAAAKRKLLDGLEQIQGAALIEFLPEHPAKLGAYLLNEEIAPNRELLEQNSQALINKASADRPGGLDTSFIVQVGNDRKDYVDQDRAQNTELGKGKTSRSERDALVVSIKARRRKIQYAADILWPWRNPGSAFARTKFKLPPDRRYTYVPRRR